jgi:hypothetical protein
MQCHSNLNNNLSKIADNDELVLLAFFYQAVAPLVRKRRFPNFNRAFIQKLRG